MSESSVSSLITMKVNTDLSGKKKQSAPQKRFHTIYTMFKIATKVMMIGKLSYLKNVKQINNLKKESFSGNINRKFFNHLIVMF